MFEKYINTNAERKDAIRLLDRVYIKILSNNEEYVCFALEQVAEGFWEKEVSSKLKRAIAYTLSGDEYGMTSVVSWLFNKAGVPSDQLTQKSVREYRLLWINHMKNLLRNMDV